MIDYQLNDQIAVVTGGGQGIGLAIAARLVASGAHVCLWDINADVLAAAQARLGAATSVLVVDVADCDAVAEAAAATAKSHGSIDILVHSAGIAGKNAPLDEYDPQEWRRVIDIDLNGCF